MIRRNYKSSAAEALQPRKSNLEDSSHPPPRIRTRQLRLTAQLLNRLAEKPLLSLPTDSSLSPSYSPSETSLSSSNSAPYPPLCQPDLQSS